MKASELLNKPRTAPGARRGPSWPRPDGFRLRLAVLVLLCALPLAAFARFQVADIRIEGLQRIAPGTVFNYLPLQVGDEATDERVAASIRALYETGFFQDVSLSRDGRILVVEVVERPAIATIEIFGNSELGDENLLEGLRGAGLAKGRTFNPALLSAIERTLEEQYFSLGIYDIDVESTVSPLPRNRVSLRIDVREGPPAAVRQVRFVGNRDFDDERLEEVMQLGPRAWWALFSDADKYSRQRLSADIEALTSFYRDRGYINFTVTSTQVSISPDRRYITVTVNVDEGRQFTVSEVSLAGELIYPAETLREEITIQPGDRFSGRQLTESADAIRERLGERGYAFANVNPIPEVNDEAGTVALTFFVDPAEQVTVRRVNVRGNTRTQDAVVRREMLQPEGGVLSPDRLERSRQRLGRLGFFEDVNIETPRVPGTRDQVDVDVTVTERLSGSVQAGVGYGTEQGVLFNFSVQQDNILGTGDRAVLSANNSQVNTVYRASYLDRFYTRDGISRNMALTYRSTNAEEAELADYDIRSLTGEYGYRIPVTENDSVGVGLAYEQLTLDLGPEPTEIQRAFVAREEEDNSTVRLDLSWNRDTRNRAIFPTSGGLQTVSLEHSIPGTDLEYYRASYTNRRFFPLTDTLTFTVEGSVAYGDGFGGTDQLPFFENYYAGGISTVRGFRPNSLGLRDENDDPIGGNARALGSAAIQFLPPWAENDASSVRFSVFVDAGQVWNTRTQDPSGADLRYAGGLGFTWYSPLGPLTMSVAEPLNKEPSDETQFFQFSLGSFF